MVSSSSGSSSSSSSTTLGALVLASLVVGAAGWRAGGWFRTGGGKGGKQGGGWRATNLRDLRQFEVEEVLSNEASPAPDGYTVFLGRFQWQVRGVDSSVHTYMFTGGLSLQPLFCFNYKP